MEDTWMFRRICDAYYEFERPELHVGGTITYVNVDNSIFDINRGAKLALDLYNKENQKNFNLVKVCKFNSSSRLDCMIVCARDGGSNECHFFRCAVDYVHDEVLLCEIKYYNEISILVDDVDGYVKKLCEKYEDQPSDTCKNDLGDGSAFGSDGVILVSPTMFRIMGEKSFSDLHEMREDYLDSCLYNKCGMMVLVDVKRFDWVPNYAKLAMNFYNKKEQKNFILVKVETLYSIYTPLHYCMTFWTRNGGSGEYRLFRAVVCIKEYDMIPAEDDACISDEDCPPLRIIHRASNFSYYPKSHAMDDTGLLMLL